MLAKIFHQRGAIFALALALLLAGCTPAGPRAFLKGRKALDHGEVAAAITEFKRATALLATNAGAWNYLGVALQRAGQLDDAAAAYQTALRLDQDLLAAHYNLGQLWLEQNKAEAAKAEFTAYTLRRPNEPEAWLKLGFAQWRAGETLPAERSFSSVLALKPKDPEAYNGLGLARLQAGNPREAAQFFAAALQGRPLFAPALLNLATVNEEYLHDPKAALADYQAYLELSPRPANYNEVKALAVSLAQTEATAAPVPAAPVVVVRTSPPPPEPKPKPAAVVTPRPAPAYRPEAEPAYVARTATRPAAAPAPVPAPVIAPVPTQTVRVAPEPEIVTTPRPSQPNRTAVATPAAISNTVPAQEPLEFQMADESDQPRPGIWHRIFANKQKSSQSLPNENNAPSVPAVSEEPAATKPEEKPVEPKPQAVADLPHYRYTSPAKPAPGDRQSAEGPFTKARLAEQDESWSEALKWYQKAADVDPSWFEAQYNAGVTAHRLHEPAVSLSRYELALAIQPDSVDARYNFALSLKSAGYAVDAAHELRKILAVRPDEVRAHLALANLCAQSLHDPAQARQHYLRVLDLQPNGPEANDIRSWLYSNSP